jgi:hypothetical protein
MHKHAEQAETSDLSTKTSRMINHHRKQAKTITNKQTPWRVTKTSTFTRKQAKQAESSETRGNKLGCVGPIKIFAQVRKQAETSTDKHGQAFRGVIFEVEFAQIRKQAETDRVLLEQERTRIQGRYISSRWNLPKSENK